MLIIKKINKILAEMDIRGRVAIGCWIPPASHNCLGQSLLGLLRACAHTGSHPRTDAAVVSGL